MTIIIKQTDYSIDFSKLLSNARIQGIRNVPPNETRDYWTWHVDLDILDRNALGKLPFSSLQEKDKFMRELAIVTCNDFNDFINNLSKELTLGTKHYLVEGDIVNGYYNEQHMYSLFDFLDNHDLAKAKKLFIDKTTLENSSIPYELDDLNNLRIKALVTVSIDTARACLKLKAQSIDVLGPCTRDKTYNKLASIYKTYTPKEFSFSRPRPNIALICGNNHGAADFRQALHKSLKQQMQAFYVNMNNIPEIIEQIEHIDAEEMADVICIVRGGGDAEDLCKYNDIPLLNAITKSRTPIVTGIGHKNDLLLARDLSSFGAPTPTAAAEFLNREYRKFFAIKRETDKEATVPKADYDDLQEEYDRLLTENKELAAKNKALLAEIESLRQRGIISRILNI